MSSAHIGWAGWSIAGLAGLCAIGGSAWLATRPNPAPLPIVAATPAPPVAQPAKPPGPPAAEKPGFDIVRISPTGDAVIAGRAAPGAEVAVTDNGREIGHTQADSRGQFVLIPAAPLAPGGQQLQLSSRTGSAQAVAADAPVVVLVPSAPSAGAALVAAAPSSQSFAVLLPPDAPPRLLQAPGPAGSQKLGLGTVDYDDHGEIRFAGSALPGAAVRLYVDDAPAGTATAGPDGSWALQPDRLVAPGDHRLRLDQLAASGKVTTRLELPFQRAAVAPAALAGGRVQVVQPKQTLWRIARETYGKGVQYTVIYEANREQIRNPDLIYPGQVFSIPAGSSAGAASSATKSR